MTDCPVTDCPVTDRPDRRTSRLPRLLQASAASAILLTAACGGGGTSSTGDASPSATPRDLPTSFTAGEYSAEGSYTTPGGQQSVEVDLTLEADGTITAVEVTPQADGGNSEQFQNKFASGIADVVEGRKITDLDVSKVSGSSLTSGGFNAAISQIMDDAAA